MAKKIPEATRSGMQHQLKDEFGSIPGMDDWSSELSNFSFDDPLDTSNRKPKTKLRTFASSMFKSTKENLGSSVLNSFFRRFPNIERAVDDTKELISEADYIKNEFVQDIAPTTEAFKSAGRMLTNQYKDKLSDKQIKKLNKIFAETEKTPRAPSKAESEQLAINEALGQVFIEQFKQQEEKSKTDERNTLMSEAVESFRHGQVSQLLNQIRINSTAERLFRQSTFTSYLKKDLELKYKHLFVAKETLASVQNLAQMTDTRLQAIAYNSALPDVQKSTLRESFKQEYYSIAAQNINSSLKGYFKNILERARTSSKSLASQLNLMSSGASMAGSMTSVPAMLAEFAGLSLSNLLGEKVGSYIAGDKDGWGGKLSAYGKSLDYLAKNLPSTIANKSKQLQLERPSSFLSFILGTAHPENKGLINKTLAPNDAVQFDQAARNSLITIIPGYLARILQQTTNIATGTSNPLLVFDNQTNQFITRTEFRKKAVTNLYRSLEARSSYIGDITGSFVGAYDKSRSFESSAEKKTNIDLINRYLNKVLINIEQNELSIDFDQIEKYVKYKGDPKNPDNPDKSLFYKSYIQAIFKDINSSGDDSNLKDPLKLQVAEALLKSVTTKNKSTGEEYVNRNMARVLTSKVNEFKNNYPTAINAVRRYRDSGQIGELGELVKYDTTGSIISIDESKERRILEEYDHKFGKASYDAATKKIEEEEKKLQEAIDELGKLSPIAMHVFNYLSGDYSAGSIAVTLLANRFEAFAKNPFILAKALLGYTKLVNKLGIAAGKEFLRIILKYKAENKDDKNGSFVDKTFEKVNKAFTDPNENYKNLQKKAEQERIAFTTTDSSTIALADIFGEDETYTPQLTPTTDAKDIVKSTVDTPIFVTDKLVLEAIKQFEKTFINYTLSTPVTTRKAKSSSLLSSKKDQEKQEITESDKKDQITVNNASTGTSSFFGNISNKFNEFKEVSLEERKEQATKALKSAVKMVAKPEVASALLGLRSKDDLVSMVLEQGATYAITKGGPALFNLVKELSVFKDDPKSLREAVDKLYEQAADGINLASGISSAVTSEGSIANKSAAVASVVGKYAKDQVIERATNIYHEKVNEEIRTNIDKHIFGRAKKLRSAILGRINRDPYVDIYSKEILENVNIDPLVTASELEQGKVVFSDGSPIPDAYSIDRPVIEVSTKNIRITKAQILEGIYNVEGQEITKRSGYWHAEDKARRATEAAVRGSITATKYGIKYGLKALWFSMGLYGKMYMMLGKLGWNLAKGGIKGLFGGLKKGSYKPGAIMGTLKGIGGGLLSGIFGEKNAESITNTLSGYKDQAKEWTIGKLGTLFGKEKVSTGTIVPETSNIEKSVEETPIVTTKQTVDTDSNEATYEKPKEEVGVRSTDNDQTPEDKIADGIERIAEAVDPKNKDEKKGIFSRIKDSIFSGFSSLKTLFSLGVTKILGGFGTVGKLISSGLGVLTSIGSSISGILSGVSTVGKLIGTLGSWLGKIPGLSGIAEALGKVLTSGAGAMAAGVTAYITANKIAHEELKEKNPDLYEHVENGTLDLNDGTSTDLTEITGDIDIDELGLDIWGRKKEKDPVTVVETKKIEEAANDINPAGEAINELNRQQYDPAKQTIDDLKKILNPANTNIDNSDIKTNTNRSYAALEEMYDTSLQAGKNNQLGKIVCPTDSNVITSPYGPRNVKNGSKYHKGIDLRAKEGDNIYAMSDGIIASTGGSYNLVTIGHLSGYITRYLHCSKVLVKKGQKVKAGDIIAKAGGYGPNGPNSYASHLHFDILKGGTYLDPEKFLKGAGIKLVRKGEKGNSNMVPMSDAGVEETKKNTRINPFTDNKAYNDMINTELSEEAKAAVAQEQSIAKTGNLPTGTPTSPTNTTSNVSVDGTTPSLNNEKVNEKVSEESGMDTVQAAANSKYVPNPNELGSLSAKFESGSQGSSAVNPNDNGKGASYGKYQINEGTGTFGEFINFCISQGKIGQEVASRLLKCRTTKERITQWKLLAKQGLIQDLEHKFIEEYKYKRALHLIKDPGLQGLIEQSDTIKDVLWSTAVQHGEGSARNIFNASYTDGIEPNSFVKSVYEARGQKAPSVKSRYKEELSLALSGLQKEGVKQPTTIKTPSSVSSTNTPKIPSPNNLKPESSIPDIKVTPPSIYTDKSSKSDTSIATNRSTPSTNDQQTKVKDPISIIEELLNETKKHTPMLQAINESVTNVSTTVKSSVSDLAKAYGTYPSSSNKNKNTPKGNIDSGSNAPIQIPTPQLDNTKKTVYA